MQVTFNYKAKESVREVYKLLNEYHREYYGGKAENESPSNENNEDEDEDDIDAQLSKAISDTKKETEKKTNLFQSVETGANGCVFIKSNIDEFYEFGERVIRDLSRLTYKKTKFTNRMVPILKVCRANMEDIINTSGELFDDHFLKEPCTFAINFNKRFNNDIQRDTVIKELASLVSQKNLMNKVNLKEPKKTILVEVIKGLCCITVINDYILLKKYNLNELSLKSENSLAEDKATPNDVSLEGKSSQENEENDKE